MAVPEQQLKTHLTTFDCKFGKWSEFSSYIRIKCPKFILFPGEEFFINVEIPHPERYLRVYVNRSSLKSTLFYCKVCLFDRFGQEHLKKKVSVTFKPHETYFHLAEWNLKDLNAVIRKDQLVIRCTLYVGCVDETRDCGWQTESSRFTEPVPSKFLSTLSSDFKRLYNSESDADFVLKAGNIKFPVHAAVLSARSAVFAAMLKHDTTEKTWREADIEDIEAKTLSDALLYIYSGSIRLTSDTAISIFTAADKYALFELRDECLQFLLRNLTLHNICEAVLLAHTHGEETLENEVVCLMDANIVEVLDSDEWLKFSTDKSSLANKIITAAYRKRVT